MPFPFQTSSASGAQVLRALIDAAGRLVVTGDPAAVAQPVNQARLVSKWDAVVSQTTAGVGVAGNTTLTGAAVPANKLWVLDNIYGLDGSNNVTQIYLSIISGGLTHYMQVLGATNAGIPAIVARGPFYLSAGDQLRALFVGTTLNDVLSLVGHGYQADIT